MPELCYCTTLEDISDLARLRTLAVPEQCVGFGLQDAAEDLAIVECRGADHSGRWNKDLVDAELAQLLDQSVPCSAESLPRYSCQP